MLEKIRSTTRSFYFPFLSIPLALLALTILSYGLRALSLGFYWDDWVYQWVFRRFGPAGIVTAFTGDRPFLSFIYTLSLSLFGSSTQGWQIFGLLARWLCGVGLWLALAQAWPRHADKAAWAAFLFTVYPGFTQQWIAVIYAQAFFLFAAVFFSIAITVWLARRRESLPRLWIAGGTLLALGLSAFTMFSTEYFFGLELLRPVLLWFALRNGVSEGSWQKRSLKRAERAALWWAPYLALMVVFVFWRIVVHPFTGYHLTTMQGLENTPVSTLKNLSLTILQDLVVSSFAAWGQPLQALSGFLERNLVNGLRLLVVIILTGLAAFFYFWKLRSRAGGAKAEEPEPQENWGLEAAATGVIALLVAGWPTWITGLPMRMGFPQDRYSLALSVGVSILFASLIDLIARDLPRKVAVLAVLLGLAAGFHFDKALSYGQDWDTLQNFFWQLTWRAPSVQPDTLFASDSMPFLYSEDDSLTAPLNWTYDPNNHSEQMRYMLYDMLVRVHSMPPLQLDQPVEHGFRAANFSGSTSRMLVFYYAPPGCVRVLDPVYDAELTRMPDRILKALPLSNPGALIADIAPAATPPTEIFGSEPKRRWCYFFEKAELARQVGDWQTIYQLGKQSINKGFRPADPTEYLVFIEGYARAGMLGDALQLTQSTYDEAPASRAAICSIWRRAFQADPGIPDNYRQRMKNSYRCEIP